MARTVIALRALGQVTLREVQTFASIGGNNLLLFAGLVAFGQAQSGFFFLLVGGLLMLFPLGADPLEKIPAERLALWPLEPRERLWLRLASLVWSPVLWLILATIPLKSPAGSLLLAATAIVGQGFASVMRRWSGKQSRRRLFLHIPTFGGPWRELVRKDLRQNLRTLDLYAALLLALGGVIYRVAAPHADPAAFSVLSIVVAICLGTIAQTPFGLDGPSGLTRYRLLPVSPWQILLSKDAALLALSAVLTAALDPVAGMSAMLVTIAAGRQTALRRYEPQRAWRFRSGVIVWTGVTQVVTAFGAGMVVSRVNAAYALVALALYLISLWWAASRWQAARSNDID